MSFGVTKIELGDKEYPELLSHISDPPKQLYCRGNISLLKSFCFGVVGTRKLTAYGREATETIVSEMADSGITIVSGLAMGIDAIAHQTALDNKLPTIAVLGSTVDDSGIGPRVNLPLAKSILRNNGLIISEYGRSDEINRSNFAVRDRVISGLSHGVLVIEGAQKSGSLITARCALDQNRDVFAVPGSIFSFVSAGTNSLIKSGAKLVSSAQDILEEYEENLKLTLEQSDNISTKNPIEKRILDILVEKGQVSIDELINSSGMDVSQTLSTLSMLEMKNKIKQIEGKYHKT